MKTKYLSQAQACAMCRDYLYLQGKAFDDTHRIDFVLVAPYSNILQWQFLQDFLNNGKRNPGQVVNNPSCKYDVLVVSRAEHEPGYLKEDLRTFLSHTGAAFNASRYDCLRNANIMLHTLQQVLG